MMMLASVAVVIEDPSAVGGARRAAAEMTAALGFDATRSGEAAMAVTEVATNILKHAGHGELLLRGLTQGRTKGIEILGLDRGPGMENVAVSLRDGHSTAGTAGTGLGALARLRGAFDIYSQPGRGTAIRVEIRPDVAETTRPYDAIELGVLCLPQRNQAVCGDCWVAEPHAQGLTLMLVDGLGHGPDAHQAARRAIQVLGSRPEAAPAQVLQDVHAALTSTRGAAAAVARVEVTHERGMYAGIGNIAARVERAPSQRSLVSHNGILGHKIHKIQEFAFPFPPESLLIMHSDGLGSGWSLNGYPGLTSKHPGLIAGVLYRDYYRGRDDVTVLVARNSAGSAADPP